jgi:hypothetical protein|tara:strand:+ start:2730 stop:3293 length:564 start_codon:yes stop_codon:yes gene_type:complete
MKLFFSIAVLACTAFVTGCSSPDEPATPTVTTLVVADTPEKSPEQELIENLWDQQAARPGSDIERVFRLYQKKVAIGPRNMACWDPEMVKEDLCVELVDAMALLDVPAREIIPLLDSLQLPWRFVGRDCEPQPITLDIQAGRVNLEIIDDVVVAYTVERAEGSWDRRAVDREICPEAAEPDNELLDE